MSSATRLVLLITLATSLTVVSSWGWSWSLGWSTEVPTTCPDENHQTHICSTLESLNATCITIKCCRDFADDEDFDDYDSDMESDEEDDNVYYLGRPVYDYCRLCYTSKPCSVYKCYSRCCDGYQEDAYGRCQNKTGHLQCQNGGSLVTSYYSNDMCLCTAGFHGKSCEIPMCECENGGECVAKDNKPHCTCSNGHHGDHCEKSNCSMQCKNEGKCYRDGELELCRCPYKYAGRLCEELFTQPNTCPVPNYELQYCLAECTSNTDCKNERVCCKEGCTTICREPKAEHCMYEGRQFDINEVHQPDPCLTCTCMESGKMICSSVTCSKPFCTEGRPESRPGQCCMSCPGTLPTLTNQPQIHCPTKVLYLNTNKYTDDASINNATAKIRAFNSETIALPVKYSPPLVRHCHCNRRSEIVVNAYAADGAGNVATCTFKVIVLDTQPPVFHSCPEDIYVFENENVQWKEPMYKDNVGIADETKTHRMNEKFPVGRSSVQYQIRDYDQNTAYCNFVVSVTPTDTEFDDLPQGLKDRSTGDIEKTASIISGSVLALLAILAVLLLLFCCRRQHLARASRNASGAGSRPPAYDNNIYATDDITVKLPPYSSAPMNPPPYSVSGSIKDATYMTISPPTYTNPGYGTVNDVYETLNVHGSKPTKSVISEKSVKSYSKE